MISNKFGGVMALLKQKMFADANFTKQLNMTLIKLILEYESTL